MTNSIKVDLSSHNQFIQALGLVAIGNLATTDMARDLASDVEKLLRSNNSYLRKKAALAVIRLLKKEPDLIEHMSGRIAPLVKDKAHGVLISGIQLMTDVLDLIPSEREEYNRMVPTLVKTLRNIISSGFSPEHDVSGITDPFLQVKLLRILRMLGKHNDETSEQMNDVLAQVATNTDTGKNAGNAILYECVRTIMEVESESSLRVLAINILGRFLLNRDNNIRYVALNALSRVVSEDMSAVQRHRMTIVDCLKDPDVSIRQRALDLVFQLVNDQNVASLTNELLDYLSSSPSDQKAGVVSKMMSEVIEKFSPSRKWRIDTLLSMLGAAGNHCDENVPRTAVIFIAQARGLQGYAVHRLYRTLRESTAQIGLVYVGVWCIGEYGDLLVNPSNSVDPEVESFEAVPADAVVSLLDSCLRLHNADASTKALVLSALVKLSTRVPASVAARIPSIIAPYKSSLNLELQQRGLEYAGILASGLDGLRPELLGKMPIIDEATYLKRKYGSPEEAAKSGVTMSAPVSAPVAEVSLLDLDDIFGGPPASKPAPAQTTPSASNLDLLSDIFASTSIAPSPQPLTSQPAPSFTPDIFGSIMAQPAAPQSLRIVAYDTPTLSITFDVSKPNPTALSETKIIAQYSNKTPQTLSNFVFLVS